jgi:hypothetical protein
MTLLRDYPPQFCGRVLRLRKQLLNANGPISSEPSLHLALGPDLVTRGFRIAHPPCSVPPRPGAFEAGAISAGLGEQSTRGLG